MCYRLRVKPVKALLASPKGIQVRRAVILFAELVLRDFKAGFLGSYLNVAWAFFQPGITVSLYWFVFEVGFRVGPQGDKPFILWILAGIVPWFFFAEAWSSATQSIISYKYLVKNIVFPLSVLPIVKICSALFVHIFFLLVVVCVLLIYSQSFSLALIQLPYYLFASIILLIGLAWLTSSIVVFVSDTGYIVSSVIQFGFWLTPIMWNADAVPEKYSIFIFINPVYYLVDGYRNVFLYGGWFWDRPALTSYFWIVTLFIFVIGRKIFIKLQPHFADVI